MLFFLLRSKPPEMHFIVKASIILYKGRTKLVSYVLSPTPFLMDAIIWVKSKHKAGLGREKGKHGRGASFYILLGPNTRAGGKRGWEGQWLQAAGFPSTIRNPELRVTGSALERDIKQNTGPSGQIEQVPESLTEVLSSPISSPRALCLLGIQQVSVIP